MNNLVGNIKNVVSELVEESIANQDEALASLDNTATNKVLHYAVKRGELTALAARVDDNIEHLVMAMVKYLSVDKQKKVAVCFTTCVYDFYVKKLLLAMLEKTEVEAYETLFLPFDEFVERNPIDSLFGIPVSIQNAAKMDIDDMCALIEADCKKGIQYFFIDKVSEIYEKNEEDSSKCTISHKAIKLRNLAKRLHVAIVVTTYLCNDIYYREGPSQILPRLSDFEETGKLGSIADAVLAMSEPVTNGFKLDLVGNSLENRLIISVLKSSHVKPFKFYIDKDKVYLKYVVAKEDYHFD